jgi:hypothetical protein
MILEVNKEAVLFFLRQAKAKIAYGIFNYLSPGKEASVGRAARFHSLIFNSGRQVDFGKRGRNCLEGKNLESSDFPSSNRIDLNQAC